MALHKVTISLSFCKLLYKFIVTVATRLWLLCGFWRIKHNLHGKEILINTPLCGHYSRKSRSQCRLLSAWSVITKAIEAYQSLKHPCGWIFGNHSWSTFAQRWQKDITDRLPANPFRKQLQIEKISMNWFCRCESSSEVVIIYGGWMSLVRLYRKCLALRSCLMEDSALTWWIGMNKCYYDYCIVHERSTSTCSLSMKSSVIRR